MSERERVKAAIKSLKELLLCARRFRSRADAVAYMYTAMEVQALEEHLNLWQGQEPDWGEFWGKIRTLAGAACKLAGASDIQACVDCVMGGMVKCEDAVGNPFSF